jgi:hypothetical protein
MLPKNLDPISLYILYIKNTITRGFIDLNQVFSDLFNYDKRHPIHKAANFIGSIALDIPMRSFSKNMNKYAESYDNGAYKRYVPLFEGISPVEKSSSIHRDKKSEPNEQHLPIKPIEKSSIPFSTHVKAQELRKKGRTNEEIRKELRLNHQQMREIFSDYVMPISHNLDASFKKSDYLRSILTKKDN